MRIFFQRTAREFELNVERKGKDSLLKERESTELVKPFIGNVRLEEEVCCRSGKN